MAKAKGPSKSQIRKEKEQEVNNFLVDRVASLHESNKSARNRKVVDAFAREQLFLDQFSSIVSDVFSQKLSVPTVAKPKTKQKTTRILNVVFSDTHYGSNLDPREVGHGYGPVEEARRTAAICQQAAQYKPQYREDTELYLHLIGDLIQGQLHDPRDGAPLAEQVASCIRVLTQALRYLAVQFPKGVSVFCATGNHGRNSNRHKDRATNQKFDSIETMVYVALREVAAFLPNVKVQIGYEPKYDFDVFGQVGFGTHGDTVLNVGFPSSSINIASITKQINAINNARIMMKKEPYSLFITGHVHTGSITHLPGGVTVLTNGCLIPPDAYAQSIGLFNTACGQWLWESVPGHIVGDARFVVVNETHDKDKSLDKIIAPYQGL